MDKRYCNGCIHAQFRAGIETSLAKRAGIVDSLPYPTHTCLLFGARRQRTKADMPKLRICRKTKAALYEQEIT